MCTRNIMPDACSVGSLLLAWPTIFTIISVASLHSNGYVIVTDTLKHHPTGVGTKLRRFQGPKICIDWRSKGPFPFFWVLRVRLFTIFLLLKLYRGGITCSDTPEFGKVQEFMPLHVPNFEELGFKVGPSFFGLKLLIFQLQSEKEVLNLAKVLSLIIVINCRLYVYTQ